MAQMTLAQSLDQAHRHYRQGQLRPAESICRQILQAHPDQPDALHLLGAILAQTTTSDAAIELIQRAITINPSVAGYHNSLGQVWARAGQQSRAIDAFGRAARLAPDFVDAHYNLAMAFGADFRWAEAIAANQKVVSLQPDFAPAWNNLGLAFHALGKTQDAIVAYERALSLSPDKALVHYNYALSLLLSGDLARGFAEYEWRCREPQLRMCRDYPAPRWDGSGLHGKRILLHSEQGLGDTIQFARYAPMVRQRGGQVVLQCQPALEKLLQYVDGLDQIVSNDAALPPFDVHCPLLSLPAIFKTTLDSIPSGPGYIRADPVVSAKWKSRLAGLPGFKVGLVWAGAAEYGNDPIRSIAPHLLAPLARMRGIHVISLQKNPAGDSSRQPPVELNITDWTNELSDFTETAALVDQLDLVISVDTAVAHLAGAMGKAVWVMLPSVPDWRWLLKRGDSPWYPTMRLFRQTSAGEWTRVISEVARLLPEVKS